MESRLCAIGNSYWLGKSWEIIHALFHSHVKITGGLTLYGVGGSCDFRLPEKTVRELIRSLREVLEMKGQSFRGFMRKSFRDLFKELGCKIK